MRYGLSCMLGVALAAGALSVAANDLCAAPRQTLTEDLPLPNAMGSVCQVSYGQRCRAQAWPCRVQEHCAGNTGRVIPVIGLVRPVIPRLDVPQPVQVDRDRP